MTTARIKIIIAMATIGTIGLLAENINISSSLYALIRALLASIEIGLYLLLTGQRIDYRGAKREMLLFVLSGAFLGLNWSLLFDAYKHIPYAVATLCDYFAPIIVIVLCPIVYKEKITLKQLICFVMATLGLLMLIGIGNSSGEEMSVYGILLGIFAMLCYVPVLMINKLIKNVNGIQRTFFQFSGAAVVLLVFAIAKGDFDFSQMDSVGWVSLVVVGLVHTGLAYCLYFSALPHLPGQEGAILSYVDPLTAVFVSIVFMKDPMSATQIIGAVLLLVFTFGNEIDFKYKGKNNKKGL